MHIYTLTFFKYLVYLYGRKEDLTVSLESNSSEKAIFCSGETVAMCKLSESSFEFDAMFFEPYLTPVAVLYAGTMSISYTKIIWIHYQAISAKYNTWKIDVNNLSVCPLKDLM